MNGNHTPPFNLPDIAVGVATLSLWLNAYQTYVTLFVTTMAAIYYVIKFIRWFKTGKFD